MIKVTWHYDGRKNWAETARLRQVMTASPKWWSLWPWRPKSRTVLGVCPIVTSTPPKKMDPHSDKQLTVQRTSGLSYQLPPSKWQKRALMVRAPKVPKVPMFVGFCFFPWMGPKDSKGPKMCVGFFLPWMGPCKYQDRGAASFAFPSRRWSDFGPDDLCSSWGPSSTVVHEPSTLQSQAMPLSNQQHPAM